MTPLADARVAPQLQRSAKLKMLDWIESHPQTIDLIMWASLLLVAWASGLFRYLSRITRRPNLSVYGPSGFCFLTDSLDNTGKVDGKLACYILNPAVKNPSERSFEIDRFFLGYDCQYIFRRFRQNLFHISFPRRPTKKISDDTHKVLPVFFTRFGDGLDDNSTVLGRIKPNSMNAAYVMFVSNTYGSWAPKVKDGKIKVRLTVETIGAGKKSAFLRLRVTDSEEELEEFCQGLLKHIRSEILWNNERVKG